MKPFLDSSGVVGDGPELARRMKRDGYLFVRGLLPSEPLESLRMQFLEIGAANGWVSTQVPIEEGVADLTGFCVEPEPKYMEVYEQIYRIQGFHALPHHPRILGLLERMFGEPVIHHPRIIGRFMFPQRNAYTTKAHQDFIPIQGTEDTYTAWVPLSDLPEEMGGLQIASGSHLGGVYEIKPALGAGGFEIIDDLGDCWVGNSFQQGDVLFFHSLAAHRGVPNRGERMRLSIDGRYQKRSDPITRDSLTPHMGVDGLSWEEIYADWTSGEFQYYWEDWNPRIVEYDPGYFERRDVLAMEMAEKGDELARSTLQRIVARDLNPDKRARAQTLLTRLDTLSETGDSAAPGRP
jgi:hypothetical protein